MVGTQEVGTAPFGPGPAHLEQLVGFNRLKRASTERGDILLAATARESSWGRFVGSHSHPEVTTQGAQRGRTEEAVTWLNVESACSCCTHSCPSHWHPAYFNGLCSWPELSQSFPLGTLSPREGAQAGWDTGSCGRGWTQVGVTRRKPTPTDQLLWRELGGGLAPGWVGLRVLPSHQVSI